MRTFHFVTQVEADLVTGERERLRNFRVEVHAPNYHKALRSLEHVACKLVMARNAPFTDAPAVGAELVGYTYERG